MSNALNLSLTNPDYTSLLHDKSGWTAKSYWNLPENHRIKFTTYKDSNGYLVTICSVCTYEDFEGHAVERFTIGVAGGGDMYEVLARSKTRCTEKAVREQHVANLDLKFHEMVNKCFNKYKTAMKLEGDAVPVTTPTGTAQLDMNKVNAAAVPKEQPGKPRTIRQIALEIRRLWTKPYFGAVPYIASMMSVDGPNDTYGAEDGKTQVMYFLSNAATWRGEDAKRIKAELKKLCGIK